MDDEHLNNQNSLRINPAVIEAEASKAAASTSRLPTVFPLLQQPARVIDMSVCVCVILCVSVCNTVCLCVYVILCVYIRMCVCVCLYVCMYVCMYVILHYRIQYDT